MPACALICQDIAISDVTVCMGFQVADLHSDVTVCVMLVMRDHDPGRAELEAKVVGI